MSCFKSYFLSPNRTFPHQLSVSLSWILSVILPSTIHVVPTQSPFSFYPSIQTHRKHDGLCGTLAHIPIVAPCFLLLSLSPVLCTLFWHVADSIMVTIYMSVSLA